MSRSRPQCTPALASPLAPAPASALTVALALTWALALLLSFGCGGKKTPQADASSTGDPVHPRALPGPWEGPLPPIPSKVSPKYTPLKTLVTTRLDNKVAHRRLGELALAAAKEIDGMAGSESRAKHLASLCRQVGPDVTADVVDRLAQATFAATQKVADAELGRLQDPYDHLAQCLAHAGAATRAQILPALLSRAAKSKDLSVFSWPFRSARAAMARLTPAQVEPLLRLAQPLLNRAQAYYHKEHLLAGMAAAGTVLAPARALALLARAEQGVAGAAFKDSREVFHGELAHTWVTLARQHPALLSRAAQAILRLAVTPYGRAKALGKLVELPAFSRSKEALPILKLLRREAAKLPATEKGWLLEMLIVQAAQVAAVAPAAVDGAPALALLRQLVTDSGKEPEHALRARIAATKALAAKHPKEAVGYAAAALDLIDKLSKESRRNWQQAPLFRALQKVEPTVRQPLLARIEKRAAGFKDKYFTAWTLRRLLELQRAGNPAEALRLQGVMMTAVAAIPEAARRVRALRGIYKLQLNSGPAAAETIIAKALELSDKGVGAWVWERFVRPLEERPKAEQQRRLPRLLTLIVNQSSTWRPDQLARWARLVARLAPQVMTPAQAEALLLQVWQAVEGAGNRSAGVEIQYVVNALRAIGAALAGMGSAHFPTLVRRMEARIPRDKAWSEHLMSYVAALGTLLPTADQAHLEKRLNTWVGLGSKETRLMRRGAIIAGLVASHGALNQTAINDWLAKGKAHLTWKPMVQFLIRLPLPDLQKKAAALSSREERLRMYRALIRATAERAKRDPDQRRRERRRRDRGRRTRPGK